MACCFGLCGHSRQSGVSAHLHDARRPQWGCQNQPHGPSPGCQGGVFHPVVCVHPGGLETGLYPTHRDCRRPITPPRQTVGQVSSWSAQPARLIAQTTKAASAAFVLFHQPCPLHPVHEDIQTQPHHVHEVPVPGSTFETKVLVGGEVTFLQTQGDDQQHQHAQEHVETVKPCEHEEG